MKQLPHRATTCIRRLSTTFIRPVDLAPGICVPLICIKQPGMVLSAYPVNHRDSFFKSVYLFVIYIKTLSVYYVPSND